MGSCRSDSVVECKRREGEIEGVRGGQDERGREEPGLVLKYLMKETESDFYLFDEEDKVTKEGRKRNNLIYALKDSIIGGPSIIFNRYSEVNKTKINNGDKICKTIIVMMQMLYTYGL
jgi:hypothetical protein